ncbi:MAG: rod shape-determining protein MreC [Gemmatimonadota bacterium]
MAAVVLLTLPRAHQLQLSTVIRSTVLAPVLQLQAWLSDTRAMRARVETLRAERDSATAILVELQSVEEEVARLRELLVLAERTASRFRAANLYPAGRASEGVKKSFVVDLGSEAGLSADAAVVAASGLVGVLRSVAARQATGDFWTHSEFRVSAMTLDGRVFGIVKPLPGIPPRMQLDGAPYQLELQPGTELVTSGLGGVFPRGIPVGRVAEAVGAKEGWARSYLVEPAIYPDAVREVMVLVAPDSTGADVADLWRAATPEGEPR